MDFYIETFFDQPIKIKGMDIWKQHKTNDYLNEKCFILKSVEIYHYAPPIWPTTYLTNYISPWSGGG